METVSAHTVMRGRLNPWLVKLLRAVPRGKALTDEQRHVADLVEKVLPKIEAEAREDTEGDGRGG